VHKRQCYKSLGTPSFVKHDKLALSFGTIITPLCQKHFSAHFNKILMAFSERKAVYLLISIYCLIQLLCECPFRFSIASGLP
jgi:hypothetical protein